MQAIRSFVFLLLVYAAVAQKITFSGNKEHKTSTTDDLFSELNDLKADFKEQNEVLSFKKDGKNSARLLAMPLLRQILQQGDTMTPEQSDKLDKLINKDKLTCEACAVAVETVQSLHKINLLSKAEITDIAIAVCKLVKLESDRVCKLAVHQFRNEVIFVVFNLKPNELCFWLLKGKCPKPSGFMPDWNISIAPPSGQIEPLKSTPQNIDILKALYFTDIHVDFRYDVGSSANCGEPLCCRDNDGKATNATDAAWRYGDYRNCDMPDFTFQSMLSLHSKQKDIDFILFTGDIPAHDVWNQSKSDQIDKINRFTSNILHHFPNTPVYAAMGNHESSPVNSYPPPQVAKEPGGDIQWLFDAYANNWKNWLPESSIKTVLKGGFYTTLIKPGFRVVSLNDNFGSDDDWWLMVANYSVDPHGQLQWFSDVMQMAEKNNEKVLILTHRPTGGLLEPWQRNYYNIINRYKNTIIAQLFGHAHSDELRLYYDINDSSKVASVAFIGPGFTTYSYLNTGHRVYEFNSTTFDLIDATSYYMDINEANINASPQWKYEYSFRKDYGMMSMKPQDWGRLVDRFETDIELFQSYKNHVSKMKDTSPCDDSCRHSTICSIKNNVQNLHIPC